MKKYVLILISSFCCSFASASNNIDILKNGVYGTAAQGRCGVSVVVSNRYDVSITSYVDLIIQDNPLTGDKCSSGKIITVNCDIDDNYCYIDTGDALHYKAKTLSIISEDKFYLTTYSANGTHTYLYEKVP